jgi:tryptophan 7-halogenase
VIQNVVILGGGSAGFLAALTLKTRLPQLAITVLRSSELGIIGVGEGSVPDLLDHLHGECAIDPARFHQEAHPSYKLGVRFLWGPRARFNFPFSDQTTGRHPQMPKPRGFYAWDDFEDADIYSALMSRDRMFERQPNGAPDVQKTAGYHIENAEFVACLERYARERGVIIREATVRAVELGPGCFGDEKSVAALELDGGERVTADLFVDASGFRSELLGRALNEPFRSYKDSLFCDRAIAGGWERTDEPILPYTTAETMDAGWCWQIEHEQHINRGYVFSSAFLSDEAAEVEFRRKNPKVAKTRVVRFITGRYERTWVGNVIGIGNASGFVEPLEATALLVICQQARALVRVLAATDFWPSASIARSFNRILGRFWDEIRDFLSVHYRFNTRLDTPFWQACRADVALHGAEPIVTCYQENGPTTLMAADLLPPGLSVFQLEGFFTLLIGQQVPFRRTRSIVPDELNLWTQIRRQNAVAAAAGLTVRETLDLVRSPAWQWTPGFYRAG